jgi:hypothetical protein
MNRNTDITRLVLLALLAGLWSCKESPQLSQQQAKPAAQAETQKEEAEPEPPAVGRITFMEKNLFRYLSDAKDWAMAMVDVPVSDGDILYSDSQGRSELTFPNDTKVRLNDKTKIQLDSVKGSSTSMFVNSGIARIQNGADNVVKVDTPYGQVLSKQPGDFDVYVGDSSLAVTAFKSPLQFVDSKGTQYEVKADADSLLANDKTVVSTQRFLVPQWDSWNNERDKELQVFAAEPSPHLPAQLRSETRTLNDTGDWEQLSQGGETAYYWTPRNVAADWSPFTVGQWTSWNGEQLWVPYERFGWVTHHHGGWIHHNNRWYWRPPPRGRWRHVPWYPARVAWVHHGRHVGWVPMSPYEVYYGRRYWGPRSVVYHNQVRHVEIHRYVHANRVIVVDKDRLYGSHRRYDAIRDRAVVREIVDRGRAAPIVTREVQGADTKMEHQFARSGDFSRKPKGDAVAEFAGRRRGSARGTATAQTGAPEIQKTSLKTPDVKAGPMPAVVRPGDEAKRKLPATPRDLQREQKQEQRQERREANIRKGPGEPAKQPALQPQQKQQQQTQDQRQQQQFERQRQQQLTQEQQRLQRQQQQEQRQQQQPRHQGQFERQQQHQLMQEQQRAQRQQLQEQRQHQQQAQQQQRQSAQQQQQAERQQQQLQRQHQNQQRQRQQRQQNDQ